ncbi:hypothetical protein [Aquitalea magnusonii]|uniref:hypothetical protein n=1 Tax=Aquitalea magnusonii TaxID=332411 RepID=UPI0011AEA0AD|nr:hypothetical protein [Aquitalea magnusonii]
MRKAKKVAGTMINKQWFIRIQKQLIRAVLPNKSKKQYVRLHGCGWSLPRSEADKADADALFCPKCGARRRVWS